ncbi:hypothetical protein [Phenylobacterium sp. NIBR 498073]|uniref:hypothetical protein n=1 Tax=Phenylobacterium sp. NIBR 498073 TaxID=3015177 RepID=UPI0022B4497E|nr:hypothetical protein [Phenylobacterium sp. NIBR 498073]WGU41931.1 hypothetical protein O4N75_09405 [Phenylobacterium sp. NIBR 498073]
MAFAAAVPVTVGVVSLVMSSPGAPLSLPEASAGIDGAAGAGRVVATTIMWEKLAASIPSTP